MAATGVRSQWKIARLKLEARRAYERYHRELDGMSCGKHLGEEINPRMREAKIKFNRTMEELSGIDPDCPKSRL
jgi:hypothetical protein